MAEIMITAFQETKNVYTEAGNMANSFGYWENVFPQHLRLSIAYIIEAFAQMGCDLRKLRQGDVVPKVTSLPAHQKLVNRFHETLSYGKIVERKDGELIRTATTIDSATAEEIFNETVDKYPNNAMVTKLIRVIGSQLAGCLRGEVDGLAILFGNKDNKKLLRDMYEFWPLLRAPTLMLGNYLARAFANSGRKYRILEVGAGSGGTTRHIIDRLQREGVDFEYVFTDISSAMVGAARRELKTVKGISFKVLDIEKPPKPEDEGKFDVIISTNCIHATKNLDVTLLHLRQMLALDGVVTLVEVTTQKLFWLDIVVGLFEGWWLFEDDRSYALVDENKWKNYMKSAGFKEVLWTGGDSQEAESVRVVAGFVNGC